MGNNSAGTNKAKVITAIVIIAAVAILYFVFAARNTASSTSDSALTPTNSSNENPTGEHVTGSHDADAEYMNGTYSASSSYSTPGGREDITVSVSVENNVITDSSVQQTPNDREAAQYQTEFRENYKPLVIGKKLGEINLSRVSGSSLTSRGFNDAIEQIKNQAHNHDS